MRLFISFSSQDRDVVRELMAALHEQQIDFWDYSNDIDSIEAGTSIPKRLFEEIDCCDKVVALISTSSVSPDTGRFTRMEIEYAQKMHKAIIPVMVQGKTPSALLPPYDIYSKDLYLELNTRDRRAFATTIVLICKACGVPYTPPAIDHRYLPLDKRFSDEVRSFAHSNHEHIELSVMLTVFKAHYAAEHFEEALSTIQLFIAYQRYVLPKENMLYPHVVQGICELILNRPDDADRSFAFATESFPHDENAFGGRGHICYGKGNFSEARRWYGLTLMKAVSEESRTFARINLLLCDIAEIKSIDPAEQKMLLSLEYNNYPLEIGTSIGNCQAQILIKNKAPRAQGHLESMINDGFYNTVTILSLTGIFTRAEQYQKAEEILQSEIAKPVSKKVDLLILREELANCCFAQGKLQDALEQYHSFLLKQERNVRRLSIKYARMCKYYSMDAEWQRVCESMINGQIGGLPQSGEDFYYCGWAQFLLGNYALADYDYTRSGPSGIPYKDHTL